MLADVNVLVDADAAEVPLSEHVRFDRQRLEGWPVELFQELPARFSNPALRN